VRLGIGDAADRGKGYGSEAIKLLLRYTFEEINLHRLSAAVPEYNLPALRLFDKAGFSIEVRQRQFLHRDGRRWDMLGLGLLRSEWLQSEDGKSLQRGVR
jgi:RimJ/RimL family protein N-acetyltransferase